MSTESTSAISRIQGIGPWHRLVDDKLVFQNKAALEGVPLDAVLYDDDGNSVAGDGNVWTGTLVGGGPPAQNASAATCLSWQSSGAGLTAIYGLADRSDSKWTHEGAEPCSDFVRLLCLRAD